MNYPVVIFLSSSRNEIETAMKNKKILERLKAYGYDLPKLKEGKALNEKATILQMLSQDNDQLPMPVKKQESAQKNALELRFKKHLQLARLTFHGNHDMYKLLQLSEMDELKAHWLDRALLFYQEVIKHDVIIYGVHDDEVDQCFTETQALIDEHKGENNDKEESEVMSEQKNTVFNQLQAWVHSFHQAAQQALEDTPELLDQLGIKKTPC